MTRALGLCWQAAVAPGVHGRLAVVRLAGCDGMSSARYSATIWNPVSEKCPLAVLLPSTPIFRSCVVGRGVGYSNHHMFAVLLWALCVGLASAAASA